MDGAFYREQEERCRRLAETTDDPEVMAALLALAERNIERAEKYSALSALLRQAPA